MTTSNVAEVAATDLAAVEAFCDRWEPTLGKTVHGREAVGAFVTRMSTSIPDYHLERLGLYAEVTRRAVPVAWHLTGTVAGTGRPIEFHGDDRLELGEDGLIHAYRCMYDNQHVLSQITAAKAAQA